MRGRKCVCFFAIMFILLASGCGIYCEKEEMAESGAGAEAEKNIEGKLTILSWYHQDMLQPLFDGFMQKYPDVTIECEYVPNEFGQYEQRKNVLAELKKLPDLMYVSTPVHTMAEKGYLRDISHLDVMERIPLGYKEAYSYEDDIYAFCCDAWVGGVFYNKEIFREYGLSIPDNWVDFIELCIILKDNDVMPIAIGSNLIDSLYWIHDTEVLSYDPGFNLKINNGEVTFSDGYLEAMEIFYEDLVMSGIITCDMLDNTDEERWNLFAEGGAAMTITGPWSLGDIYEQNPDIKLGIFPFVGRNGQKYAPGALNLGVGISSDAENVQAAEAYIEYIGSDEGLKIYQSITGNFLGIDTVEYILDPIITDMTPFAESGSFALPNTEWVHNGIYDSLLKDVLNKVVQEELAPVEALEIMDRKQEEVLTNIE